MIYTCVKTLQFISVPVYTIFKNLAIIVIAYGEVFLFGSTVSPLALLAFALMILSSVVAGWADIQSAISASDSTALSTLNSGYIWMGLNVFCSAAYSLGMNKGIKITEFSNWDGQWLTLAYGKSLTRHSNFLQQLTHHSHPSSLLFAT